VSFASHILHTQQGIRGLRHAKPPYRNGGSRLRRRALRASAHQRLSDCPRPMPGRTPPLQQRTPRDLPVYRRRDVSDLVARPGSVVRSTARRPASREQTRAYRIRQAVVLKEVAPGCGGLRRTGGLPSGSDRRSCSGREGADRSDWRARTPRPSSAGRPRAVFLSTAVRPVSRRPFCLPPSKRVYRRRNVSAPVVRPGPVVRSTSRRRAPREQTRSYRIRRAVVLSRRPSPHAVSAPGRPAAQVTGPASSVLQLDDCPCTEAGSLSARSPPMR